MRCDIIIILFLLWQEKKKGVTTCRLPRAAEEGSGAYRSKRRSAAPVLERVAV